MRRRVRAGLAVSLAGAIVLVAVVVLPSDRVLPGERTERVRLRVIATRAFAGYLWNGRVTAVSATWDVPSVGGSTLGSAATWIGAQSGGASGPFIQIGIAEGRQIPADDVSLHLPAAAYPAFRYAFWSDTYHKFHLLPLAPVQSGDIVDASLTLVHGRWRARLVDARSLLTVHFSTHDEAIPLRTAEWLQEDVTDAKTNRLLGYPRLATVRFGDLRVDGTQPNAASLIAESMSPKPGVTLVPSPVNGDGFTVPPGH